MDLILNLWIYFLVFAFGAVFGSFLNVLIIRTHFDQSWWQGRSKCPNCHKELSVLELIPIFSFIFLRGKCKHCGHKISLQYPLVELASAALAVLSIYMFGFTFTAILLYFSAWLLLGDFVSDLLYMELPEIFNFSLLFCAILYQIFIAQNSLISILLGVAFGFLFFFFQFILSKKQGIGEGDLRLGIIIGAFLGWPLTLFSILSSYVVATLVFVPMIILKKISMKSAVPLGVFLLPVLFVFLFWKQEVRDFFATYFIFTLS